MTLTDDQRDDILSLAEQTAPWMMRLRRQLHQIPEPAFAEHQTAALLAGELAGLGLAVRNGVGGTGIVADLDTARPGRCVALRADMDALRVTEAPGAPHRSRHDGFAHCCGHDGNMAAVLGAVKILIALAGKLRGRLRVIFQPGEEEATGARAMIDDGAMDDPPPGAILAVHAWPGLAANSVGCRPGSLMAACDDFMVRITGAGGHGARPQEANNPVAGIGPVVDALDAINTDTNVVSVCVVRAGQTPNVIPDTAVLRGTLRSLGETARASAMSEIVSVAAAACEQRELDVHVDFTHSCPELIVPENLYDLFRTTAADLLGDQRVVRLERPSMGSEDFAFFLRRCPGLMFHVGMGAGHSPLHNCAFDFNDDALAPAASVLAAMALQLAEDQEKTQRGLQP